MSLHHPSLELIKNFSDAKLEATLACVVSAHIEHCSTCKKLTLELEQALASNAFSSRTLTSTETNEAWTKITARIDAVNNSPSNQYNNNELVINGLKYHLPKVLRNISASPIKWMPFGNGGQISKVGEENGKSLFLIYLSSNEQIPLHSHEGSEHSYVIAGSYSADGFNYETGDFSISTKEVIHSPIAGGEDGCLILSSVEKRLNFFQGLLKPLNSLLWIVLNLRLRFLKYQN